MLTAANANHVNTRDTVYSSPLCSDLLAEFRYPQSERATGGSTLARLSWLNTHSFVSRTSPGSEPSKVPALGPLSPLPLPRIPRFILQQREEDLLPASYHVSASHKQLLVSLILIPLPCGLLLPFALFGPQFIRRTSFYTVHVVPGTHTLLGRWQNLSYGML